MQQSISLCLTCLALLVFASAAPAIAQSNAPTDPQRVIEVENERPRDRQIEQEINEIFSEIETLNNVVANVNAGVVTLRGVTATAMAADRAEAIALRVAGVVTVENGIERDASVDSRISPAIDEARNYLENAIKFAPLFALAAAAFLTIAFFGWLLSGWRGLWRRVTPNLFIAELAATTIRIVFLILAAIAALSLLDATAFLGAFLGAAGVLGLAIGFAVRDTIENYIASIMLSLRQPFRPNDLVKIDDREGHVIRLTSRATILMSKDGNHLRIPNASVFKAVIVNYTRNSERRFEFELGVDADDNPLAAIETGLAAMDQLEFVLKEPAPVAYIKDVGDSNIVLFFGGWIDQRQADFQKSRSAALSAVKTALEDAGFALPEPIYRLRFDGSSDVVIKAGEKKAAGQDSPDLPSIDNKDRNKTAPPPPDIRPDTHIADKVEEERRASQEEDLLDNDAPVE